MTRTRRRIAVTGLGAVSAWGWGVEPLWRGLASGRTAIGPMTRFAGEGHRTAVAAEVPDEPPAEVLRRFPGWAELSRSERFALAAADEAVAAAGGTEAVLSGRPESVGLFFGGSTAGMVESEEVFAEAGAQLGAQPGTDPLAGERLAILATQPLDVPAAAVARHLGLGGPVVSVSSACASGTQALGAALDALRSGEVDAALAGGADSLSRLTYAGFNALRVVDEEPCRPFRAGREGMSLGEGAGFLVLETEERVRQRASRRASGKTGGGEILAYLLGVGNSCDAHHMTAPHPEGLGAGLALERALAEALEAAIDTDGPDGSRTVSVAFLNAHGTGTPMNDLSEWRGMVRVFGEAAGEIPLTATKSSVGHLLGSSGAIEAVATVRCLVEGRVHPTADADGELDPDTPVRLILGEALELDAVPGGGLRLALSTSFGFGGANAAAVFGPTGDEER